ncbi:MAG: LytTR family transcriptional regulator [Bacteroidaceae bacterium]|nr:LytTR family transcriptional regulator [Bacteroidaceae bacterium]
MRTWITILYWMLSMVIAALVVTSAGYTFQESLFMGSMFLPGAIAAKYLLPKVSFKKRSEGIQGVIYIVLAILVFEFLIIILANNVIQNQRHILEVGRRYNEFEVYEMPIPGMILNPFFISLIISVLAIGGSLIDRWLKINHPELETPVTFCSERKKVTLLPSEIVYVESCDTEVLIHASDGRILRNRTSISQWEALLGEPFIRVHRAFLVNSKYVSSYKGDTIKVGDEELPVSRKYQKDLKELFPAS